MRHLNCRRVIYFIRNIFTVSQVQNTNFMTKFTLSVVHTFEVAGELRGASKTADSRIIPSYLERARRHSLIRDIFFFFVLFDPRVAYQLRDNYYDGIRAYLTLIGCPHAAKIFKQPLELIPRVHVTERVGTINIMIMWWGIIGKGHMIVQHTSCLQKQSCNKKFIATWVDFYI